MVKMTQDVTPNRSGQCCYQGHCLLGGDHLLHGNQPSLLCLHQPPALVQQFHDLRPGLKVRSSLVDRLQELLKHLAKLISVARLSHFQYFAPETDQLLPSFSAFPAVNLG